MKHKYYDSFQFRKTSSSYTEDLRGLRELENHAARTIQLFWLKNTGRIPYKPPSESSFDEEQEGHQPKQDDMRELFDDDESHWRFLKFYESLPSGVDKKKAF